MQCNIYRARTCWRLYDFLLGRAAIRTSVVQHIQSSHVLATVQLPIGSSSDTNFSSDIRARVLATVPSYWVERDRTSVVQHIQSSHVLATSSHVLATVRLPIGSSSDTNFSSATYTELARLGDCTTSYWVDSDTNFSSATYTELARLGDCTTSYWVEQRYELQ
ncbi:hypothetical protein J6590_065471 [Homalodisca vitripennis]|nr:hypothetical protein J6590_065471 [Homalodisca vitripennis]